MTIQPAYTPAHLAEIEALAYAIMPDFYDSLIPHDHNIHFIEKYQTVAALQGQLAEGYEYYFIKNDAQVTVGYLALYPDAIKKHTLLSKLYLHKAHRGSGYGSFAMAFIIKRAAAAGQPKLLLTAVQNNLNSIRFYKHHGFFITGKVIRSFDTGHHIPNYIMERVI